MFTAAIDNPGGEVSLSDVTVDDGVYGGIYPVFVTHSDGKSTPQYGTRPARSSRALSGR